MVFAARDNIIRGIVATYSLFFLSSFLYEAIHNLSYDYGKWVHSVFVDGISFIFHKPMNIIIYYSKLLQNSPAILEIINSD